MNDKSILISLHSSQIKFIVDGTTYNQFVLLTYYVEFVFKLIIETCCFLPPDKFFNQIQIEFVLIREKCMVMK